MPKISQKGTVPGFDGIVSVAGPMGRYAYALVIYLTSWLILTL